MLDEIAKKTAVRKKYCHIFGIMKTEIVVF